MIAAESPGRPGRPPRLAEGTAGGALPRTAARFPRARVRGAIRPRERDGRRDSPGGRSQWDSTASPRRSSLALTGTQNYVRPEIALEPHVSFRAIATFSPRPPYFLFLPFLAVFLAAVFFFAALRLAAIMLHLL